jgi:site-specific DNA recombinase
METAIRDVLAETDASITQYAGALTDDEQMNVGEQCRQMERDRLQLEKINRRLQGLMSAIEGGLYTTTLNMRFKQFEDQAERLRARLRVNGRMLASSQREPGWK